MREHLLIEDSLNMCKIKNKIFIYGGLNIKN